MRHLRRTLLYLYAGRTRKRKMGLDPFWFQEASEVVGSTGLPPLGRLAESSTLQQP